MAYFAQAGSDQPYSHNGSRNEGASDRFGHGGTGTNTSGTNTSGPKITVNPHVTARSVPAGQAQGSQYAPQAQASQHHATQHHAAQHQVSQQPVSPRASRSVSPFPAEGPDLYANYQPRPSETEAAAAPIAFAVAPPAAAPLQQPKLQDYVSEDYSVPGIGAQDYSTQSFRTQSYAAAPEVTEVPAGAGHVGQDFAALQGTADSTYGGAAAQSYGYETQDEDTDYGYDDDSSYVTPGMASGLARATGLLGATASLALVIGLGVWGYQLVMRDVSGVPVVRAVEGPMRAQPENPGGSQADHQGLAVNSVAANGTAEAPAERLTLAPQPIELSQDDQPMSRLTTPEADVPPQVINQGSQTAVPQISEASVTAYQNGDIDALVAELTDGVARLEDTEDNSQEQPSVAPVIVQPEPLQPVEIAAIGAAVRPSSALLNAPGVKISLRPTLRPARFSPAVAQVSPGAGRATLEVDPNSLPAGTRLAQLGAYESAEVARAEWDRIYHRFEDYLEGKTRVIQRAESGGRTFYRLRAMGFDGLSDARRFCSTLVAGKADCIPVTTR
ncbi:SPOR domain-containing protein [Pseudophaeobacter arcticus]|uniref:SPOR domain-containing protein n=1 Tax=Pseudophaeobacter arcticus TaxID=385492 RepID=UPI003A97771D